jgi:pyridoxal 5-phosphate dependent beta-lyase
VPTVTDELPHETLGARWSGLRMPAKGLHADTAASGRTSTAVRAAVASHLDLEAELGAYVAEGAAAEQLTEVRRHLGGLLGFDADDVALVESGSAALAQLLAAWPLQPGDRVWAVPSEWGPNLSAFADFRLEVGWLDVDDLGRVDLEALRNRLRTDRPAFLHLTAMASHRPLVQPVEECAEICTAAEVPVIVDTAQSLAQVEFPPGAAAVYGTGRKFLCGPRGVGYLAVRDPWQANLVPRFPALPPGIWPGQGSPMRSLESREAFVAGRIGLGTALREYSDLGPRQIHERLHGIGRALRAELAEVPGWVLTAPVDAPGSITSLQPEDEHLDVAQVRAELLRRGVVSTACGPERAPGDITRPLLRFSPHLDLTLDGVRELAAHLRET